MVVSSCLVKKGKEESHYESSALESASKIDLNIHKKECLNFERDFISSAVVIVSFSSLKAGHIKCNSNALYIYPNLFEA